MTEVEEIILNSITKSTEDLVVWLDVDDYSKFENEIPATHRFATKEQVESGITGLMLYFKNIKVCFNLNK